MHLVATKKVAQPDENATIVIALTKTTIKERRMPVLDGRLSRGSRRCRGHGTQEDAQRLCTKCTVHPVADVAKFSMDKEHSAQDVTESFDDLEVLDSLATQACAVEEAAEAPKSTAVRFMPQDFAAEVPSGLTDSLALKCGTWPFAWRGRARTPSPEETSQSPAEAATTEEHLRSESRSCRIRQMCG